MEIDKNTETVSNKRAPLTMWKYSLVIALTLIGGYIVLIGILIYPLIHTPDLSKLTIESSDKLSLLKESRKDALEAIKATTTVFGPWIAALVAFYFAGKQLENVSEQLGEAQKTITASMRPDGKLMLEGKFVKDMMVKYDPNTHKIPIYANAQLTKKNVDDIKKHIDNQKNIKCFVVYKDEKEEEIEGIITTTDVEAILKTPEEELKDKKLEDFTTDMVRLIKVSPTQSLAQIQPSLTNFNVLPVFEGKNIVGFVYKDDVFKIMTGVS